MPRIARELHDTVSHAIAVTVLQARGGAKMVGRDDEAVRRALAAIEHTNTSALADMRRLLGLLRSTEEDGARAEPQPSLERLDELVEEVRSSGLPVELEVSGDPLPVPPGLDLSAYRIVQEALTNVLKHAGPQARARVELVYGTDGLEVAVTEQRHHDDAWGRHRTRPDRHPRARLCGGRVGRGRSDRWRLRRTRPTAVPVGDVVIRVVLADDQPLVRTGLRMILSDQEDIDVVGEAADGARGDPASARRLNPDVVLMDVRMPGVDGIDATRAVTAVSDPPRVLVLTTFDLDDIVYDALRAGASGFLLKDAPEERLITAIRVVADGGSLFAPSVTRRLIEEFARRRPPTRHTRGVQVTDRTRDRGARPPRTRTSPTPRSRRPCSSPRTP